MDLQFDFHSELQEVCISVTWVLALEYNGLSNPSANHWKISTHTPLKSDL